MAIKLKKVIPLGRNLSEYTAMFGLAKQDLQLSILDCGGGPSSFNYEVKNMGGNVTSIDPIYTFSATEIQSRIEETFDDMMRQAENNKDKFVWDSIKSIQELRETRKNAMQLFIEDYENGKLEGRYLFQELPELRFNDETFDLALSSHFLFLYSDILSYEFHRDAIAEMLRVAREVRIFPLVDLNIIKSGYVAKITDEFRKRGYSVDIIKVEYEFQKGANEYMKIASA